MGNLPQESTSWLAGTETRHDFLVHGIYFSGLHYGRQGRDNLVEQKFIPLASQIIIRKASQTHLLIYRPLHIKCFQHGNTSSNTIRAESTLIEIVNSNQHDEVSEIKDR